MINLKRFLDIFLDLYRQYTLNSIIITVSFSFRAGLLLYTHTSSFQLTGSNYYYNL